MDRDSLHKNGLLEQYLLGLTSREETQAVEEYLASDPEARKDLEFLRAQLGVHLEGKGIPPVQVEAPEQSIADAEVIAYLQHRNEKLTVLRALFFLACLVLLATTVYFYRQTRQLKGALLSEEARHVQDDHLHELTLKELAHTTVHLDSMKTVVASSDHGALQMHFLTVDSVVLLDLSHLRIPQNDYAYHVHLQENGKEFSRYVIGGEHLNGLYPINKLKAKLVVLYGPKDAVPDEKGAVPELVARVDLSPEK